MSINWEQDWWKWGLMGIGTLVSPLVGGSILLGALANEEESQRVAQQREDNAAVNKANGEVVTASWQKDMEDAQRQAEDIQAQIGELGRRAEANNAASIDQLKVGYGYDGQVGTAWADYINNSVAARQSQGSYSQAAASSGLKNSGSIATMGRALDQNIQQAAQIQRSGIEGGLRANIAGIKDQWDSAQFTIGQAQKDLTDLNTDWAGYDWEAFSAPAAGAPLTRLQALFQAKQKAFDTSFTANDRQYQYALEDKDPFNIWNILNGTQQGIGLGMNLMGTVMGFGV
jgi:hypothetical protein